LAFDGFGFLKLCKISDLLNRWHHAIFTCT